MRILSIQLMTGKDSQLNVCRVCRDAAAARPLTAAGEKGDRRSRRYY